MNALKKAWVLIPALMLRLAAFAQDAPVTTCATVNNATPYQVSVPVTVTGFTNIGAVSLSIDYDYSVMQFLQGTANPALNGFLSGDYNIGNGFHRVNMGWYGSGVTLPDNSTIMTLIFTYTGGNSALTWYDNGPSCEYADPMGFVLNDEPPENFYINGYVCSALEAPGPISGTFAVCQGAMGMFYSIPPISNVTGYHWTVPDGAEIVNGQNTNAITVNYTLNAQSGAISVAGMNPCGSGPSASQEVIVNPLPLAYAGNDTTINYGTSTILHAATGGPGTYLYHWSPEALLVNPDVQNPQTVLLTFTTVFSLVVTDAVTGCASADDIVVGITGGPLSVNPISVPANLCLGESAQLYANAGGGSEAYSYLWTCLPQDDPVWSSTAPNPLVAPEETKMYYLTVNDGFTEVNGSVGLEVYSLPEGTISGGDTLCGTGNTATLQVDLAGTPPWSFIYTNGITSWFVNEQYTTPYLIITGDPGTYTITDLQDLHCSGPGYGSARVDVFPYPLTPEVTVIGMTLVSDVCCGNQWYLNNTPIPGATGQTYTATQSGEYFVIVTLNGCSSDPSETVDIIVGIGEENQHSFLICPNPAENTIQVQLHHLPELAVELAIFSIAGQPVSRTSFSSKNSPIIDISNLAPGYYFVRCTTDRGIFSQKLLVR